MGELDVNVYWSERLSANCYRYEWLEYDPLKKGWSDPNRNKLGMKYLKTTWILYKSEGLKYIGLNTYILTGVERATGNGNAMKIHPMPFFISKWRHCLANKTEQTSSKNT